MAAADHNDEIKLNFHKHPHYHLRLNKAIDRLLFIDIIKAFNTCVDVHKYCYIGFGGPYLEDFKLLSYAFPEMKMISLESDEETFKRQEFHKCSRNLELINDSFKNFIDETEVFDKYSIIAWLDYTDNKIERFREIETLSNKMGANSLVRFTLKAQPYRAKAPAYVNNRFRKEIRQICVEYLSYDISERDLFRHETFSKIISDVLEQAIYRGLNSSNLVFQPLHRVRYSDGTQMLSVTGLIREANSNDIVEEIKKQCSYITDAQTIDVIDIPSLTLKERFHIEKCLPNQGKKGEVIAKQLNYMLGIDEEDNLRKCEQYEKYYPYYPYFNKIIP